MITCAMSAHWFDLPSFYRGAAQLLKPGGTLAMWTRSSLFVHPRSVTGGRGEEVQGVLFGLERGELAGLEERGNRVSREMYDGLGLPWEVEGGVEGFSRDDWGYVRREWNREGGLGVAGNGVVGEVEEEVRELDERIIESLYRKESLEELASSLGTASMVTRWREANRERVESGEIEDCVQRMVADLRGILGEQDWLELGTGAVVLILRKADPAR